MFRITRVAVLLWAAMSVNAEANVRVESVTTPGGQRFLFSHMTETSRVVFHVAWPSNRDKESDTNPMVPYLGIRLMTAGGSGGMDASELMERFRDLDASARLWLTSGYIRAFLNVHVDHLDEALKLTRTVRASPRFDERWLVRTREKMHGELKWSRATVASRGWDAVRRAVLGRQPIFESLTLAEFEALERVTREDLLPWHRESIRRGGSSIRGCGEPLAPGCSERG